MLASKIRMYTYITHEGKFVQSRRTRCKARMIRAYVDNQRRPIPNMVIRKRASDMVFGVAWTHAHIWRKTEWTRIDGDLTYAHAVYVW